MISLIDLLNYAARNYEVPIHGSHKINTPHKPARSHC